VGGSGGRRWFGEFGRASALSENRVVRCGSVWPGRLTLGRSEFLVAQNDLLVPIRNGAVVCFVGVTRISNRESAIRNLGSEEGVMPGRVRPAA
jgi:hypothetical protein